MLLVCTNAVVATAVFDVPVGIVGVIIVPPTCKLPAMPAPPLNTNAPVVVLTLVLVDVLDKLPEVDKLPLTEPVPVTTMAPPTVAFVPTLNAPDNAAD
jgi:hypothetical protein